VARSRMAGSLAAGGRTKRAGSLERPTAASRGSERADAHPAGLPAGRAARVARKTRETDIVLGLSLDGAGRSRVRTGIGFLDHMLTSLATHARFDLDVRCRGDLHVDAHHSVEDVGIALGQAVKQALGDKKGIVRFGCAYVPLDEALSRAVVDLSGRPWLHFGVQFRAQRVGDLPTELLEDFFWALVDHGRFNLHLDLVRGRNAHHVAETLFKATARALAAAVVLDPRVVGVPSTKGSL
jgi:imidazoleglycerol-phosphate dehydratase